MDPDPPTGHGQRMSPRTTSNVENAVSTFEAQSIDEEVDLLFRAFRERVTEIRRAHVVGQAFEPVTVCANFTSRHQRSFCFRRVHLASDVFIWLPPTFGPTRR